MRRADHAAVEALEGFLPAWDVERRRADVSRIVAWTLRQLLTRGFAPPALEKVHDVADARAAARLAEELTRASAKGEGLEAVLAILHAVLPELPWEHVELRTRPRFRVLVPGDAASPLPLHTDFAAGRHLDERNVWMALTPAHRTAGLCFADLAASLATANASTRVVDADRGDVLLFTPLHRHGAQVIDRDADTTRWSIDVRLAPARSRPA